MKTVCKDGVTSVVEQNEVIIPDLTVKDLLSAIPLVPLLSLLSHWLSTDHRRKRSELTAFSVQRFDPLFICKTPPQPHRAYDRV
jgi:hypothetical protein